MRKKILVVDDEDDIVTLVRMILEDAGYEVGIANDGRQALEKLTTQDYDLVLLDIMMPVLSGWEVLNRLRNASTTRNLPVAMLTARASPRDDNQQHLTNYSDYITKPFEPDDLIRRIERILSN